MAETRADERFVRQLKKGALEMLVLRLLAGRPCHGYELLLRLRESSGLLALKEGTLYPILYRLEDEGCIASAWQSPTGEAGGPKTPRKVYTITAAGRETLDGQIVAWREFSACVETLLQEGS